MDVWRITVAALRRWYVLLPLLIVTAFAATTLGNGVAPEYEARTSAMIVPGPAEPNVLNPYGGPDEANAALGIVLDSVETRRAVQEQGLAGGYEVGTQSRSAIFQLAIRADAPDVAEATGAAVLELARQELATRQTEAGLNASAQYSLAVLEPPAVISIVQTGKTRVQAVIVVLGGGLSLLVAVIFDDIVGLVRRLRSKRSTSDRAHVAPWDTRHTATATTQDPTASSVADVSSKPLRAPDHVTHNDAEEPRISRRRARDEVSSRS